MGRFSHAVKILIAMSIAVLTLGSAIAQDESVIVIGFEQEGPNLAPLNTLVYGQLPNGFFARDLWEFDTARNIMPQMAAAIPEAETTEDGNTRVVISLREGLVWSDGTPITSADCEMWHNVRSDTATSTNVSRARYPEIVTNFEVIDDLTFAITYDGIFPDFLAAPEQPQCPYPAHIFNPMIADGGILEESDYFVGAQQFEVAGADFTSASVGFGPYVLTSWNIGEGMELRANPNWPDQAPAFDRVVVVFITDDTQMRNAMDAGEVDVTFGWSDDLQGEYDGIDGVDIFPAQGVFSDALWIRSGENGNSDANGGTALQDPLVRQAIAHAIDRITLAEQLIGPGIAVPTSWYPNVLWPDDLPFLEYNVDGAVALLEEAGWTDTNGDGTVDKDGIELANLRFVTTENTLRNNYQLVIQEYLAAVGIGTDIQIIPATTLFAAYGDRGTLTTYEWDLAIFANSADPLTPLGDADSYQCSGIPSDENPGGFNPWQFCDPEYDAADSLIAATLPGPDRDVLIAEAVTRHFEGYFWHGLRLRATWFAVNTNVVTVESVQDNVGTLASNWFNQIENWEAAGS
ncbi:MAG: ABC transporter substrate-binding protein [Phototrophicaceae bacterium]